MTERPNTPRRVSTRASSTPKQARPASSPTTGWAPTGAPAASSTGAKKSGGGTGGGNGGHGPGVRGTATPEGPRWKKVLKITGIAALISLFVAISVGAIGLMVVYSRLVVPEASDVALAQASTVYWAGGEVEMGRVGEANREIIALDTVPDYVPHAVVAAEDRSFYTNPGIDFVATARALYSTIVLGNTQGGSTITQQYVERYYVGETTTDIPGKIKEALLALKVDSEQTKDEVLENYMNTIYFGRGAYGIEAAAQAYYDKPASELTLSEAALLAGIIPAPSAWDPRFSPERAEQRWNYVIDGMVEGEFITQAEADAAEFPETVEYVADDTFGGPTGYILRAALDEAMEVLGITQEELEMGGYQIVTTVRRYYQNQVERAIRQMPEDHADNLYVAASVLNARTGAIHAMYGGADYLEVQRNAVTQDIAQAGSTFKPFTMIGALSDGYSLETTYESNDSMEIEGFENPVRNFAGVDYGRINMIKATQDSVNTYYVQLNDDIGPERTVETAVAAGLPEDTVGLSPNLANVLGTASPTQMQMAHAYTTIADTGLEKEPFIVSRIFDSTGEELHRHEVEATRVFDEDVNADATYAMQQVVQSGSASKAAALGRPLAGKTGTSNDNRSAWFIGFSPQLVGAVTLYQSGPNGEVEQITPFGGYSEITGGSVPLDTWIDFMGPILERTDVESFPPRASVGEDRFVSATPSPSPTPSETVEPEPTDTAEPIVTPTPEPTPSEPVITPTPTPTPEPTASTGAGGGTGGGAVGTGALGGTGLVGTGRSGGGT